MTAASDISLHQAWVTPVLGALAFALLFYVIGRVHQYFKRGLEREQAYRDGYNTATKSLFSLATRMVKQGAVAGLLGEDEYVQEPSLPPPVAMRGRAPVRRPRHLAREDDSQELPPPSWRVHESA